MDKNLNKKKPEERIAKLESQVDHLETELTYLNDLLIEIGFSKGIETLKNTAEELLFEKKSNDHEKHLKKY